MDRPTNRDSATAPGHASGGGKHENIRRDAARGAGTRRELPPAVAGQLPNPGAPAYRLPLIRGWRPPHLRTQQENNVAGILFLAFGIFVFLLQDVAVKLVSGGYPVHEIVFIRSVVALPLLLGLVWFDSGLESLATRRMPALFLRGLIMFSSYLTYYLAIAAIPLADVVAITFSSPLFITVLSIFFLKEKVGLIRVSAILAGFVGVVLITQPGSGVFDWAALLAVFASLTYGISALMARSLGRTESGAVMAFYATIVYLGISAGLGISLHFAPNEADHPSLAFLTRPWVWPNTADFLLMGGTGVIAAVGLYCLAQAYRIGESSIVAPFEYTGIIWATLWGVLLFGEVPAIASIAGMILVVAAGLVVILRERQRNQAIVTERGRLRVR